MMFYTYILQSTKNNQYYVGHTENIETRLTTHNNGGVKSTRYKRPWRVVYFETFESKLEANQRELEIKKKKSRKYIDFLIENKRE
jgi:putative endonuclease